MNSSMQIQRLPVARPHLQNLVNTQIAAYFLKAEPFTAYMVTQALRLDNPMLEIEHEKVRSEVIQSMFSGIYSNFPFTSTEEDWNGEAAMTYRPTASVVSGYISPITHLPPKPVQQVIPASVGFPTIDWPSDDDDATQPDTTDSSQ